MQRIISRSIIYCLVLATALLLVSSPLSVAIGAPSEKTDIAAQQVSVLAKPLLQAKLYLKQNKIRQAISGYADIVLQKRTSVADAKIQFAAATALASLQRKRSPNKIQKHTLMVTSTAYSSHVNQTDDTPWIAAWGDRLKDGMKIIAVSRDLLKMGLGRGSIVRVHGIPGNFVVLDKMNRRWRKRIDIYTGGNLKAARWWGTQTHQISFLTGLDSRSRPTISRKHYDSQLSKKYPLSPLQKALSKLKIRCNRQRPSCKKWIFLKRKKILAKYSGK